MYNTKVLSDTCKKKRSISNGFALLTYVVVAAAVGASDVKCISIVLVL